MHAANLHWFGPDDPPLLTCHNVMDETPSGPAAYRAAGATVEICHLDVKNTHVPNRATPASGKSGQPTTWHGRVFEFFDEHVKHPSRATAPEAIPAGGPITGPSAVTIRCVHAAATIHYTVDGSEPSASSPECQKPLTVQPGQTLRTIAVVTGLAASPVATYTFDKATHPAPVIRPAPAHFVTKVGVPFHADFAADGGDITWHVCGRRGNVLDRSANPARIIPWLEIDARSGRLHGTPTAPGYAVVLVVATTRDGTRELADARQIVVSVEGDVHAPDPIPQSGR